MIDGKTSWTNYWKVKKLLKVAILDDDNLKIAAIVNHLQGLGHKDLEVTDFTNVAAVANALLNEHYDVLLVDLVVPLQLGGEPDLNGGKLLLERLDRDGRLNRPAQIVGITAFNDALIAHKTFFADRLWCICEYGSAEVAWKAQLTNLLEHVTASKRAVGTAVGYDYDVCVISALADPERAAFRDMAYNWEQLVRHSDPTRYFTGSFFSNDEMRKIICCAAPGMGMPLSAALTTKICLTFRPRLLIMVGICAGREGDCNIGDVLVADPCWDYGSGKFQTDNNAQRFSPNPTQVAIDPIVRRTFEEIADDSLDLLSARDSYNGEKPATMLEVRIGPMASGAAVRADDGFFDELAKQNRKVLGIDMEAYGVVSSAREVVQPAPKVAIVKGVQDFADGDKGDKFRHYAARMSAEIADRFIRRWDFSV